MSARRLRLRPVLLAGLLALWAAAPAHAGTLDRDTTFGTGGLAAVPADHTGAWRVLSPLADGRFYAAGQTPEGRAAVARYAADGALDPTWAGDQPTPGVLVLPQASTVPARLLVLPDGRVVLGATTTPSTSPSLLLARLTADGHVEPTFGTGGVLVTAAGGGAQLGGLARAADGSLVAAGRSADSPTRGVLVRLSADGAPDTAFATGGARTYLLGSAATGFDDVALDDAGRIVVAGGRAVTPGRQQLLVARLSAAGNLDATFGSGGATVTDLDGAPQGTYDVEGRRLRVVAGGRLLVAATVRSTSGPASRLVGLARFTTAGAPDPAFATQGTRTQDISPSHQADLADLAALPGGGFVVAGSMVVGSTTQFALAGFHDDGSADGSLNPANGAVPNATNLQIADGGQDRAAAVAVSAAGRLLVGGTALTGHDVDTSPIIRLGGQPHSPVAVVSASWPQSAPGRAVRPGQTVAFDGSASSDPDGTALTYAWDLDGDGKIDHTGPKVSWSYGQARTVGVLLRVTDADGSTGTSGTTLLVAADQAPEVHFTSVAAQPTAGKPFGLHAVGSDPDGHVASYAFDLDGDGSFETPSADGSVQATVDHKGPATFRVRVTDDEGATAIADTELVLKDAPCVENPVIKAAKAVIVTQGADVAGGVGCFHGVTTDTGSARRTVYTTSGHFRVNGIEVDTKGATEAKLVWVRGLSKTNGKLVEGATTMLHLTAPNVHVAGTFQKTDFAFRDGSIAWDLDGDKIAGFVVDPNAGIGGLPLKVMGTPKLLTDGTSTLDVLPGTPAELLGKTPSAPKHLIFGPTASGAAVGAFSFTVDEIPLGVIILGPVVVSYDGAGTWLIQAQAEIPYPVPTKVAGKLVIVNDHVKSVDLELEGALPTPTPIVIQSMGVHIDFGPKVAANPDCVKTVGLVDTTPYDNYKALDYYAPFLRPLVVAHPELYGSLFRKTYQKYPVPTFALCGHIGLSLAEVIDADVGFGFARYDNPYPNLFFFQGKATIVKLIEAQVAAEFTTEGYVHFSAAVKGGYPKADPWIGWELGLDFEYFKQQFNAEVYAKINVLPLDLTVGAEVLGSNKGLVACLYVHAFGGTWRPGAGAKWGHGPTLYLFGCDVGDYKVAIKHALSGDTVIGDIVPKTRAAARSAGAGGLPVVDAVPETGHGNSAGLLRLAGTPPSKATLRSVRAHAAQAAPDAIDVPADLPGTVMGFKGAGAPPHVVLHGPKGEAYDTGADNAPAEGTGFAAFKNPATGLTEVAIQKPSGGRWTVELAAGSSRLVEAIQADGTVPPAATGRVSGSGQDRRLAYTVRHLPKGARVDFLEAGDGGGGRIGTVTADGGGTLAFHPAVGAPGKRELQAVVRGADGFLIGRLGLGTYVAPAPARPARATRLTVKRSGRRLVLRWHASAAATRQQVDLRTASGLDVTRILKRSTTSLALPAAGSKLVVTITGTTRAGLGGRPARFTRTVPRARSRRRR